MPKELEKKTNINTNTFFISIVIPVYNNQEMLEELVRRLVQVLAGYCRKYEIILVDDGSRDNSWKTIQQLKKQKKQILGIKLMRNFGQQNAIAAGLDHVSGDIIVIMDADLQDRPEDIPKLVDALQQSDAPMAISKWIYRQDSLLKKFVSWLFFVISNRFTKINHQPNLGVFRALHKEVIEELRRFPEKSATTLSLLYWIGFDYIAVELQRDARFAGKSAYTFRKMMGLALNRLFAFSMFPIRAATYSGLTISLASFIVATVLVVRRLHGFVAPGWTSIVVLILFLFGLNFIFLGIIGEYLGRIFWEAKQRPKYIIKTILK